MTTQEILQSVNRAKKQVALLDTEKKNKALSAIAESIEEYAQSILRANAEDLNAVRGTVPQVMLDRLALNESRIKAMADGVRALEQLPDPTGIVLDETVRPNGLEICKITVPLGVVAVIFESRPNVTSDAAALCIKSGNACVLRAGRDAHNSARVIVRAMRCGLEKAGITPDAIGFIEDTSRDSAYEIMRAKGLVDLLIPRGGKGLIKACVENATVPCIETGTGICHVYVDESADFSKALDIIENAKCSRPSVCNAMEVCLVNSAIASEFLPLLWQRVTDNRVVNPVTIYADGRALGILNGRNNCFPAEENHFDTEFLDYKMAVAVVDNVEQAVGHISAHSTHHSDCIVTEDEDSANYFTQAVDSAAVYVNASTRFTDGGEFGLGCEMGISTQKLHARGPVGLKELTTYKYLIVGDGNIR